LTQLRCPPRTRWLWRAMSAGAAIEDRVCSQPATEPFALLGGLRDLIGDSPLVRNRRPPELTPRRKRSGGGWRSALGPRCAWAFPPEISDAARRDRQCGGAVMPADLGRRASDAAADGEITESAPNVCEGFRRRAWRGRRSSVGRLCAPPPSDLVISIRQRVQAVSRQRIVLRPTAMRWRLRRG